MAIDTMDQKRINAYLQTLDRIEPDIATIDRDTALASIAISLKRIADASERMLTGDREDKFLGGR